MLLPVLLSFAALVQGSGHWCSKCVCTLYNRNGPPYIKVLCDSTLNGQKSLTLDDSDEAGKVKELKIQNYQQVKLDVSQIGFELNTKRGLFVNNVDNLTLMQWAEDCNHTFVNISSLSFSGTFSKRPVVDSIILKNSYIPEVPREAMAFASVNQKFITKGVTFGDIRHKGIILPIGEKNSVFLMDSSKVVGRVEHMGVSVRAGRILVTSSEFAPGTAPGFRLFATQKAVISDSSLGQAVGKDFFDLYSPVILLLRNRFVNATRTVF